MLINLFINYFLDAKRKKTQPQRLNNFIVTTNTAAENDYICDSVESYWKTNVYFVIMDNVIANLKKRFSKESLELASAVDNFFLINFKESLPFINHYKVIIYYSLLFKMYYCAAYLFV